MVMGRLVRGSFNILMKRIDTNYSEFTQMGDPEKILFKEESFKIIGICMKIHSTLGKGFLESVYSEVLEREFVANDIPYEREKKLELYYEAIKLNKYFKADFLCYNDIILEIK